MKRRTTWIVTAAVTVVALIALKVVGIVTNPFGWQEADPNSLLLSQAPFSIGIFSIGLVSAGVFSIGLVSVGIFSIGVVNIGLVALGIWGLTRKMNSLQQEQHER